MLKLNDKVVERISDDLVLLYDLKNYFDSETLENIWYDYIKRVTPQEKRFKDIIIKLLRQMYKEVFDNIKEYPDDYSMWIFNRAYWIEKFTEIESKFVVNVYKQEGQKALDFALRLAGKSLKEGIPISTEFDIDNPEVINAMVSQVSRFPAGLVNTTEEIIRNTLARGIEEGESIDNLALRVTERLGADSIVNRAEMIARSEAIYASNAGAELGYLQSGVVEGKEWLVAADERTCEICMDMDGRKALIGSSFEINDIKENYGLNFDYTDNSMPHPPLHPNCYDKETEVYTNKGWKYFKDLNGSEKILSLHPNTFNLEWLPFIKYIKYKYNGYMINYKSQNLDLLVTPEHNIVYYKKKDIYDKNQKLSLMRADEFNGNKGRLYRNSKWIGSNNDTININGQNIKTEIFCKFMGIYLSEGCIYIKQGALSKYYQITIAQKDDDRLSYIYNEIKDMPFKLTKNKGHITSSNKAWGEYLQQFGKSRDKYIPDVIKDLSPKYIEIFLDMYNYGDGSKPKDKYKYGHLLKGQRCFYTSSKKMADDLGELILKINKHPSFYLDKQNGIKHFKNGDYYINVNMWLIKECKSPYALIYNIKKIKYNDYVYDIELPKNHTLYTRRNGKVVWGSNCRCTIVPLLYEVEMV